jgi:predicted ATPase
VSNPAWIKRFIFTGTPSSGKTSVIMGLEKCGHVVIYETAAEVIALKHVKGINKKPWEEPDFLDKMARMQKDRQMNAATFNMRRDLLRRDLQFYERSPFYTYTRGKYLAHWKNTDFTPSSVLLDEIDSCLQAGIYPRSSSLRMYALSSIPMPEK